MRSGSAIALLLIATSVAASAGAQGNPERIVEDLNRDAMEAYNALDINKAGSMLEEALRVGYQAGVHPALIARTHMNLGVVYVGGVGDPDAGLNSFVQALCLDPSSQLDPLTSTPDIQNVFNVAVQRARAGACPTGGGAPPGPGIAPQQAALPPPPDQALVHHSPPEQLSQTPLPLYVEINPLARAAEIFVVYKGVGMKQWKRAPMYRYQTGFAYQISCTDVWEPKVSYYIEARDDDERIVGTAGTAAQPIEVPIVAKRTQPQPALPGAVPPESCVARECPPGLAGCEQPGTAAIGESCERDSQCQSGLECSDDECRLIGAGGTEVPEYDPETGTFEEMEEPEVDDPSAFSPTYVQLGFTIGLAYVQAGMIADRPPPDNRVFIDEFGAYVEDPFMAVAAGQQVFFPEPGATAHRLTAWVPDANSADSIGTLDGNCTADGVETGPMQFDPTTRTGLLPSRYCVRVKSPGFVANPALRLAIGHFLTQQIAIAAILRFQFSAGEGTLPNMLVGARGEYMLTEPRSKGLMISAFAGGTFGEIQAQPPADGDTEGAPFVRSGLFGVHAGATFRYRFSPNFGLFAAPEFDLQLPTILLNFDLTLAGLEAAF